MSPMDLWVGLILLVGLQGSIQCTGAEPLLYEVQFKGAVVATQTVVTAGEADLVTITTSFEAELPVFVATHRYSETMSVSYRPPDGTVVRMATHRDDGGKFTDISATLQTNGVLKVLRQDRQGISTNWIAREEYDFHSLILYGTAPADFLTPRPPARVLQVATGAVEPVVIQTIAESSTFERQNLPTAHLLWKTDSYISHSWHPERFSNLPQRYVRQTDNGKFTFTLLR